MAKVISWKITSAKGDFYAYITGTGSTKEPLIRTEQVTDEDARRIGQNATLPGFDYDAEFAKMKAMLTEVAGYTNLGEASDYNNILSGNEVLMLVGADGKNLTEQTNPFYSFHLSNQSIAIGTGEDYKLDLNAIIEGNAFFERDGVKYGCNGGITVQASSDIQNYFQISYESSAESSDFKLTIKKGLQFPKNDAHMIEILIVGRRADGFEAKAVLTMAAVLGGKEGVSYDLVVSPKQFHYDSLADATNRGKNDKVTVGVLRNGKRLSSQEMAEENLRVGYEYDPDGSKGLDVDIEDITYAQLTSEGTYEVYSSTIRDNGGSVSFYLISNGQYIDTDSASVVVDGVDGQDGAGVISLELENEFEAIGVGDDSKIDISGKGGVTAQTNVRVYSGETSLVIDKIEIDPSSISTVNNGLWQDKSEAKKQDSNGEHYGTIRIILKNGFEFGSDLRDKLNIRVTCQGIPNPKPCNFTLLGVKGGKEGVVYRIEPSDDAIMYDPNMNLVKFGGIETAIPVSELNDSHKITASAKAGMHTKTDAEIVNDNEYISYSIGQTFSTAGAVITPTTPHINNKVKISDILGVSDPSSRFVTFYWIKKVGEEYYMLDRETVPVISDGRDGEGGLVVDIDPKFINVATDETKAILADTNINVRVGFMSGSTIADSSVASSVTQNLQSGSITRTGYKVGDDKYHEVTLTLNKGGVFSQDGMAAVKFICKSGEEERAATFYIYSSTGGKGDKGDKGPQTRLRDWSAEHANGKGSGYQAGGENDDYIDIVWHRNKYYLCKKTHDPIETSASGQGNEPGLTGEAEWEKYWEEYDAQPFTASKIATFGVWPNGWVIDKGKIQHTLSAITLDADGEINVQSPAELLYEYNGSNGTTIYATRDYEDPNIRALYSGNSVPVYVDSGYKALNNTAYILGNDGKISLSGRQTISIRTYRVSENHILPGYSLSDILEKDLTIILTVAERELSFKNRYTYSEKGEAVFTSGSGTCRQVVYTYTDVIEAGDIDSTDFYSIPKHQKVVTDVIYSHTYVSTTEEVTIEELKNYQWPKEPAFVSSSSPKQILLGSSVIAEATQTVGNDSDLVREGEFVPSFSYDNDIITCPSDSNYYSDSVSSDKALFTEETGSTSTRVVKDLSMDKNSSVTSSTIGDSYFVYFDKTSFETAYNNDGINIETLDNIVGDYIDDGSDLVLYNRTARPAFSKQDEEDGISTKINATKERVSVEDGRIMLAAGINNNANYIYKWKHDDSKAIYEIYGYKENFKSFEHGQTVLIYTTNETNGTQIPVSATIYKTGTITGISYNETIYYYAEAIPLDEPVQFAATRIFENGKIVTNGLHAHNGVFNGRIEATSGTFSGEINAEGGNIRNVSIENADINGNLNIRNGKSLTIYNTNSEPSVTLSSAKIDGARNTKNVPFGSASFYDTRKGWGTKTVLIEKVVVPKGYKLKIPKFRVRTTSFTRVGDRSVFAMYYQTGTTRTYIQGANNTSISKSSNFTTSSTVFTANQDVILSLYATFSYELKGDAWIFSDSKIGLSVTPEENGEITYTNTTVTISKSEIGTNGFVFANKNGSRISMVTGDDGNTNIDILVNGGLGFSIDSNKFAIIYGNYSYNLKDILNKLTELGVTPEQV